MLCFSVSLSSFLKVPLCIVGKKRGDKKGTKRTKTKFLYLSLSFFPWEKRSGVIELLKGVYSSDDFGVGLILQRRRPAFFCAQSRCPDANIENTTPLDIYGFYRNRTVFFSRFLRFHWEP